MDSEENPNHLYCPDCDTSYKKDDTKKVSGSMDFSGVLNATQIVQNVYNNDPEATLEEKAVVTAQITGLTQEQWFEGFKAGQLATALFHRSNSHDGKNGIESHSASRQHKAGTRVIREDVGNGEDSGSKPSDPSASGRPKRVRELVAGVEFSYDSHLIVPDNVYMLAAEMATRIKDMTKNFSFTYEGGSLSIIIRDFK